MKIHKAGKLNKYNFDISSIFNARDILLSGDNMKNVIFLVTSIDGLRKQNFINQLKTLNNKEFETTILLAMTNFDEIWRAKESLDNLSRRFKLPNIKTITLFDIFGDRNGVELTSDDLLNVDLDKLTKYEDSNQKDKITRYVDGAGNIVAETNFNKDEVPITTSLYDENNRLKQVACFDKYNQLFGIQKYIDGKLTETILLNDQQKVIFRFILHNEPMRITYTLGNNSVLSIPQDIMDENRIENNNSGSLIDVDAQSNYVRREVINYTNYERYYNINSFYREILESLDSDDSRIYVDIENITEFIAYLPNRIIFNY